MEHNKTGKYLKYAIGEIILVVIGILIALQINNWNEKRINNLKANNALKEVKKDLIADTTALGKAIGYIKSDIEGELWFLPKTTYNESDVIKIENSLGGFYYDNFLVDKAFKDIIQNSDIKSSIEDSIFDKLSNYYTTLQGDLNSFTQWDKREVTQNQVYMRTLENTIELSHNRTEIFGFGRLQKKFPMLQSQSKNNQLIIDFALSIRGRNHYRRNYTRHLRLVDKMQAVKQESIALLNTINHSLKLND